MQIAGATFLIAGGGSGLGAATAQLLASRGANIVIADLNADAGTAIATQCGANAAFIETNVCDEASVTAAARPPQWPTSRPSKVARI